MDCPIIKIVFKFVFSMVVILKTHNTHFDKFQNSFKFFFKEDFFLKFENKNKTKLFKNVFNKLSSDSNLTKFLFVSPNPIKINFTKHGVYSFQNSISATKNVLLAIFSNGEVNFYFSQIFINSKRKVKTRSD
jgi:hypothetical protein